MRRRRNSRRTNAGQRRPHQWQCEAAAGAAPPEWLRRRRSSASRMSADHPVAAQVNRDASLSCRAPDSGASDRRARAVPGGCSGNAVRQHVVRGAGRARRSLRHSKFGHDRSSCRSGSGYGRRRRETAGLIGPRGAQTGRRHVGRRAPHRAGHVCRGSSPRQATHARQRPTAPNDTSSPIQQSSTCRAASASRQSSSSHLFRHSAPDIRASAQPPTSNPGPGGDCE